MQASCQKFAARSWRATWTEIAHGSVPRTCPGCSRSMSSTSYMQAAKSTKKTPPKAQRVIPEYRTPTRKVAPAAPPKAEPKTNPLRHRTIPIIFGSITLFALSGYCTYLIVLHTRAGSGTSAPSSPAEQADISSRYDSIARSFDAKIEWTEKLMGLEKLRKKLAQRAYGDVLEVSIGTGRNLEFYDWDFKGFQGVGKMDEQNKKLKRGKVRSFTAVDRSAEMLEIAHEKFCRLFPGVIGVRWIVQDASKPIPGPPRSADERSGNKDEKYDTVIQTMGLCSVADPAALLRNLGECVKEDSGRILLLEHGRGEWDWLNGILDRGAEEHAKEFGCWWNRELGEIVKGSGLEIVQLTRKHGGTTWMIELRKPGTKQLDLKDKAGDKVADIKSEAQAAVSPSEKKGWW
ncbi:hypothetical protein BP5796_08075 [Coleophoma crateriformis]|uniref:Uncharacterized protein n=1 Tax=Coleophoma crateriformis TaxID=565419 RepID=A0A3D8RDS3_9HELO|nr:hypothetical protein BP5796_08075 [Coleophoma crateriformis]